MGRRLLPAVVRIGEEAVQPALQWQPTFKRHPVQLRKREHVRSEHSR